MVPDGAYVEGGTGKYVQVSSRTFKENIETLGSTLSGVMRLRPAKYHYKDHDKSKPKNLGFIAEEVEAIFPSIVSTDEEGNKGLGYSDFAVIAISAIQELKAENDALKQEISQIKKAMGL